MEFLTPAEKILKLRKMLKMSEMDLQDEKFCTKAQQLGIELKIEGDYILMLPEEEAENYCIGALDTINSIEECEEISIIIEKYHLKNILVKMNKTMGDLYFNKHNCEEAFIHYINAVDNCMEFNKSEYIPYLYNRLGMCKLNNFDYNEALIFFNAAYYYSQQYKDRDIEEYSLFNIALCHKKQNNFDKALEFIDKYLEITNMKEFNTYIFAKVLKANCIQEDNPYEAIKMYKDLIHENENINERMLGLIYNSLADAYLKNNDFCNSEKYFNKSEIIRNEEDNGFLAHTLIDKADLYIKNKNFNLALNYIKLGLEIAEKYNDCEYILKGKYRLLYIFANIGKNEEIEEIYNEISNIVSDNEKESEKLKKEMVSIFLEKGDIKGAKKYLNI